MNQHLGDRSTNNLSVGLQNLLLYTSMKRDYIAFIALGVVFLGLAASGRSNVYYGVAVIFFIVAFVRKRRATKQ